MQAKRWGRGSPTRGGLPEGRANRAFSKHRSALGARHRLLGAVAGVQRHRAGVARDSSPAGALVSHDRRVPTVRRAAAARNPATIALGPAILFALARAVAALAARV